MGKFKKGDFVRRTAGESLTTNDGRHGAGFVGQIADIVKRFTTEVVFTNGHAGLIDMYEPWQPRVGERVRFTDKVPSFWFFGPAKEYKDGVIKSLNSEGYRFCVKTGDAVGHVNIEHIEPILSTATPEQPATLKIEAGKFYRTRDGRKAKVERARYGDSYDFVATFEGWSGEKVYKKDGKHGSRWIANNPSNDIIAEWIDEPVAKPSNDNAKPKFKVGDRVRMVRIVDGNKSEITATVVYDDGSASLSNNWQPLVIKFDEHVSWAHSAEGRVPDGFGYWVTSDDIELIRNPHPQPPS